MSRARETWKPLELKFGWMAWQGDQDKASAYADEQAALRGWRVVELTRRWGGRSLDGWAGWDYFAKCEVGSPGQLEQKALATAWQQGFDFRCSLSGGTVSPDALGNPYLRDGATDE